MATRKGISKKVRFEVFKRDSFKCQYCGRGAPDVLLHADHIHPVSKGGVNDIANLITACSECNLGKGAALLDDKTALEKQRHQLEELNERREQLELMLQWREELLSFHDREFEFLKQAYRQAYNAELTEYGVKQLRNIYKIFGLNESLYALERASAKQLERNGEIKYMAGICWSRRREANGGEA